MESSNSGIELGTIICKYCDSIIDTLDTEKVTVIYGVCENSSCISNQNQKEKVTHVEC
ncbi:GapA-binding peptide SR1P [Paenibacillus periandrae]|uniref:GapA-binding peptide SR1P n=1 Tax=Paenibacillus periandrae TaxID=1761741 RepID=UPI001F08C3BC|nr:GapA-binding peptide SR1P [Paenibacillus periandrae]